MPIATSLSKGTKLTGIAMGSLIIAFLWIWNSGGNSNVDEVAFAQKASSSPLESDYVLVGDVTLHVVFAGPEDGEPIVLLHGFPETWFIWRRHIEILADAGYRVAAPDLRGYNRSGKPSGRQSYSIATYSKDIVGLLDSQGWQQVNIVGHDVGAHILWWLIFEEPDRVRTAIVYSVPHPLAKPALDAKPPRAAHKAFFKLPILPELFSRAGGLSIVANNLQQTSRDGTFSDEEVTIFKSTWDREHAFAKMIGFYRASQKQPPSIPEDGRPSMPVMYYSGGRDNVIEVSHSEDSQTYLAPGHVMVFPELSHWLLSEEPDKTASDILNFLSGAGDEHVQ